MTRLRLELCQTCTATLTLTHTHTHMQTTDTPTHRHTDTPAHCFGSTPPESRHFPAPGLPSPQPAWILKGEGSSAVPRRRGGKTGSSRRIGVAGPRSAPWWRECRNGPSPRSAESSRTAPAEKSWPGLEAATAKLLFSGRTRGSAVGGGGRCDRARRSVRGR